MSEIEELQGRIVAAMQRIRTGLDGLGPAVDAPEPGLAEALEEERLANAQLAERILSLRARHDTELATLKKEIEAQSDAMARLDMDVQRLRQANDQLRDSNAQLRAANEEGVGAPRPDQQGHAGRAGSPARGAGGRNRRGRGDPGPAAAAAGGGQFDPGQ